MQVSAKRLFLELLQCAIWDRQPDVSLFSGINHRTWDSITQIALEQSTQALIADRILLLPTEHLPSQNKIAALLTHIKRTENRNQQLKNIIVEIQDKYRSINVSVALLKGQANAKNYPNPLLRAPGDIDFFLYNDGDYDKANQWVKEQGFKYHVDDRDGHRAFEFGDVMIENHKFITFFERDKYNNYLTEILKGAIAKDSFEEIEINRTKIKVLPPDINALYIFLHFFFHFIHGGVGFRQFCDWILFLSKHQNQIDKHRFTELAKLFDVYYPMQQFAYSAIKHLGASPDIFPFDLNNSDKYSSKIIDEIFEGGNFGFFHEAYLKPYKTWTRRWLIFKNTISKTVRMGAMSPQYMLIIPIFSLINRCKKILLGE